MDVPGVQNHRCNPSAGSNSMGSPFFDRVSWAQSGRRSDQSEPRKFAIGMQQAQRICAPTFQKRGGIVGSDVGDTERIQARQAATRRDTAFRSERSLASRLRGASRSRLPDHGGRGAESPLCSKDCPPDASICEIDQLPWTSPSRDGYIPNVRMGG